MNQSKSLDKAFLDRPPVCEKGASHHTETAAVRTSSPKDVSSDVKSNGHRQIPCKLYAESDILHLRQCSTHSKTHTRQHTRSH